MFDRTCSHIKDGSPFSIGERSSSVCVQCLDCPEGDGGREEKFFSLEHLMASHKEMLKAQPLNQSKEKLFQIHPGFFSHENSCMGNGKTISYKTGNARNSLHKTQERGINTLTPCFLVLCFPNAHTTNAFG